jgi:hypothetical protein
MTSNLKNVSIVDDGLGCRTGTACDMGLRVTQRRNCLLAGIEIVKTASDFPKIMNHERCEALEDVGSQTTTIVL